jgi:hypothetical protein
LGPGFDLVRLALCYEALLWHCWVIGEGSLVPEKISLDWIWFELMAPMFFALSGLLVAGSSCGWHRRAFAGVSTTIGFMSAIVQL